MSVSATSNIIDGKEIAALIRLELKQNVEDLRRDYSVVPGLAVILVGDRKDSATYVRMKKKACEETGIVSFGFEFSADSSEAEVLSVIDRLNNDPQIDGILVQLPLPAHMRERTVLERIVPSKDVDGLCSANVARLSSARGIRSLTDDSIDFQIPCTPLGCIELLDRCNVAIQGKRAVVIGRSNLVGLPVAMLLLHRNATVTIVHSQTLDIPSIVSEADIVIAAVGRPGFVKGDWIKEGAVVIDVGINAVDDASAKLGYRLVGDVEYNEAKLRAGLITPVPGGVGPMTIAMLLRNAYRSCYRKVRSSIINSTPPSLPPVGATTHP